MFLTVAYSLLKGCLDPTRASKRPSSKDIVVDKDFLWISEPQDNPCHDVVPHENKDQYLTKSDYFLFPNTENFKHQQQIELLAEVRKAMMPQEFYQIYNAQYPHTIFHDLRPFGIHACDLQEYENKFSVLLGYSAELKGQAFGIDTQEEDFFPVPNLFSERYGPAYDELRISKHAYQSLSSRNKAFLQEIRGVFYALLTIVEMKMHFIGKSASVEKLSGLCREIDSLKENLQFWKRIALFVMERRKFIVTEMKFVSCEFIPSLEETHALGPLMRNYYCFF